MVLGPVLAFFPIQIKVTLTLICVGKMAQTGPKTMNFRLIFFSRTCPPHFVGKKCYFCMAKSSGVQKNTTFFDEVLWGVIEGPPLKNTILGRSQKSTPCIRRILEKSAEIPPPPGGWPSGGGGFPTFFRNSANTRSGCPGSSQDRVF